MWWHIDMQVAEEGLTYCALAMQGWKLAVVCSRRSNLQTGEWFYVQIHPFGELMSLSDNSDRESEQKF